MPDPNLDPETDPVEPVTTEPAPVVETPVVPQEETVDFWKNRATVAETKFSESTREAQLLAEAERQRQQTQQELTKEPTDSELRTAFPEWDSMSDTEKRLATRTLGAERNAGKAAQTALELQAERSLNTSIDLVLTSNTALQGKEQAFRQYVLRPQYKGVPMDVLVDAFLSKSSTAPAPAPTPKLGLLPSNGGPRTSEKPKGLSAADLSALRTSDEKAYLTYVKTHNVNVDDL